MAFTEITADRPTDDRATDIKVIIGNLHIRIDVYLTVALLDIGPMPPVVVSSAPLMMAMAKM